MEPSNRILLGCVRSQCILGPIHCLHNVTLEEAHFHIDDPLATVLPFTNDNY